MEPLYYYATILPSGKRNKPSNLRRIVIAGVLNENGDAMHFGVSQCSKKDQFVRKVGRDKAAGFARSNSRRLTTMTVDKNTERLGEYFIRSVKFFILPRVGTEIPKEKRTGNVSTKQMRVASVTEQDLSAA